MSSSRDFDPRTRAFSDEELKPQPMIKKSRKQFVPDEMKDDKYWARRRKNNMAAKRSRDARRMKENQIALRAGFLEKEVSHWSEMILEPLSHFPWVSPTPTPHKKGKINETPYPSFRQ